MPTHREIAGQWHNRAAELTAWTADHVLNRSDRWESFLPLRKRKKDGVISVTSEGQLTQKIVGNHYAASKPAQLIGVWSESSDEEPTSRWMCIHTLSLGEDDPVRPGQNFQAMLEWYERLKELSFDPILEDTDGSGSYRLLVLLDLPTPTAQVTEFAQEIVQDYGDQELLNPPRLIPHPTDTDEHGTIDTIRLPGLHHTVEHHSAIWDGNAWLVGDDAIDAILEARKTPSEFMRSLRLKPVMPAPVEEPEEESEEAEEAMTLPLAVPPAEELAPAAIAVTAPTEPHPDADPPSEPLPVSELVATPSTAEVPENQAENHAENHALTTDADLVDAATQAITTISQRTGLRENEIMKRVFHWLAQQDELVQAVVLGQIPPSVQPDIRRQILKQLNR